MISSISCAQLNFFPFSQNALEQLLHTDRFFKHDFAVVLQPFLKHADPPRLPVRVHQDHVVRVVFKS